MKFDIAQPDFKELNEVSDEYELIYKDINVVLDELNLTGAPRVKHRSIIQNLERQIADIVRNDGCASIPYIGNVRKHPSISVTQKYRKELKEARAKLSKEEYRDYVRKLMNEEKAERIDKEQAKAKTYEFRKKVFKPYLKILNKFGETYANLWLYCRRHWTVIEFNQEVEDTYSEYYGKT